MSISLSLSYLERVQNLATEYGTLHENIHLIYSIFKDDENDIIDSNQGIFDRRKTRRIKEHVL